MPPYNGMGTRYGITTEKTARRFAIAARTRAGCATGDATCSAIAPVAFRGAAHEGEAVLDLYRQPRVRQRSSVNPGKIFSRDVEHGDVDLDQGHRLDRLILEQLFGRPAVAAADNQRGLGSRMGDRRDVDKILVIEELVLLRGHHVPVEPEQLSERLGIVNFDRLIRRLEAFELARRANEETAILSQVFGQDARQKIARRRSVRHRGPRDGSPEISLAAVSSRPASCAANAQPWPNCRSCSCRRRHRWSRSRARARCEWQDATRQEARCR